MHRSSAESDLPALKTDPAATPILSAGVEFLVAIRVVASRAVLELEEQEAVEEPVFRAVGKPVYDIGPEFIDRPVQPVAAALVDQSQILNSGRPVALLGGGFAGRGGCCRSGLPITKRQNSWNSSLSFAAVDAHRS